MLKNITKLTSKNIEEFKENLFKKIINYNPYANIDLISKAIDFSYNAHKNQTRASGQPYIIHPLSVAMLLAELKTDSKTISAGILHDVIEDTSYTFETIKNKFGEDVAKLVEGVTKNQNWFSTKEEFKAENIRKMLLAAAKDSRIMLIKLADRLHNMQTLKYLRPDKQKRIAKETLEIYAPIAEKLGVWRIKGELEDLSLRYLKPEIYTKLKESISEKRDDREKKTNELIKTIQKKLTELNIKGDVYGRAKYFYSIYKKMKKYNKNLSEIYDLIALRIIVNTIPECYIVLNEIVLKNWKLKTGRLKDYIKNPKENEYQSIHATVETKDKKLIEIQIRTRDMHIVAEDGIAAHWKYKETERDKHFDRKISWMKQILDWQHNSKNAKEFVENVKINLFENEIIALTPKGDPISLKKDSTPVDFAYEVHTNIGNSCFQAKINGKIVSLDTKLKPGDIVEIITKKNATPSRHWLKFVKSSKAKAKIKNYLGLAKERVIKQKKINLNYKNLSEQDHKNLIEINGKKKPIKFSKCCNPKYGDPIRGFYTKDNKITIHKSDCSNIFSLDLDKEANICWIPLKGQDEVNIIIKVNDRHGIFAQILNILTENKIKIVAVKTEIKKNSVQIILRIEKKYLEKFKKITNKLKNIEDVQDITIEEENITKKN